MANLIISGNNIAGAISLSLRYRVLGSGSSYTEIDGILPSQMPYTVIGVATGQYEVGIKSICTNGAISGWSAGQSTACTAPAAFSATLVSTNIVVNATLTSPQTKIQVQITDPNGGIQNYTHDFGSSSGTFNIPVTAGLYGNYSVQASAICDDTVNPIYASAYSQAVVVNYPAPSPNTQTLHITNSGNVDLSMSALIFDGQFQQTGVPIPHANSASPAVINQNYNGGVNSTVTLIVNGYVPSAAQLYVNGGSVHGAVISGSGPFSLTFSGVDLSASQNITITINP